MADHLETRPPPRVNVPNLVTKSNRMGVSRIPKNSGNAEVPHLRRGRG